MYGDLIAQDHAMLQGAIVTLSQIHCEACPVSSHTAICFISISVIKENPSSLPLYIAGVTKEAI